MHEITTRNEIVFPVRNAATNMTFSQALVKNDGINYKLKLYIVQTVVDK